MGELSATVLGEMTSCRQNEIPVMRTHLLVGRHLVFRVSHSNCSEQPLVLSSVLLMSFWSRLFNES